MFGTALCTRLCPPATSSSLPSTSCSFPYLLGFSTLLRAHPSSDLSQSRYRGFAIVLTSIPPPSAPCIRGHRSTKCNHAAERVMVPVRKPGRPLSSCPCAPGRPCACGGVKVAIPRKQKCHCGPGEESPPDKVNSKTPAAEPPLSPTVPIYRVQKSGTGPRQNGNRKQSFDPVNLDRMDPSSFNILEQYGSLDRKQPLPIAAGGSQAQPQVLVGPGSGFVPALPNGFEDVNNVGYGAPVHYDMPAMQQMAPSPVTLAGKSETENRATQSPTSFPAQMPASLAHGPANCYRPSQISSFGTAPMPKTNTSSPRGCCCGPNSHSPEAKPIAMTPQHSTQSNGGFIPQIQTPMDLKHQQYPVPFPQPAIYTYPANYGSWSHPVNQAMWAQMQHLQPNPVPYATPVTASSNGSVPSISHECNCGPGCHCVGCLAHPFNQEMLQYVGGAWDYDMDVSRTEVYGNNNVGSNGNPTAGLNPAVGSQGPAQKPEPGSPPQAPTPSDASGSSDEHALSTSDYFFVNMPLFPGADTEGDACRGTQALCPCGDDCPCDGCVVHNAKPLEPFGP